MMWGPGFGWIWMLLILAIIIGLVVWAVTSLRSRDARGHSSPPPAHRILDERFARGEIDEEEYRRRLDELER